MPSTPQISPPTSINFLIESGSPYEEFGDKIDIITKNQITNIDEVHATMDSPMPSHLQSVARAKWSSHSPNFQASEGQAIPTNRASRIPTEQSRSSLFHSTIAAAQVPIDRFPEHPQVVTSDNESPTFLDFADDRARIGYPGRKAAWATRLVQKESTRSNREETDVYATDRVQHKEQRLKKQKLNHSLPFFFPHSGETSKDGNAQKSLGHSTARGSKHRQDLPSRFPRSRLHNSPEKRRINFAGDKYIPRPRTTSTVARRLIANDLGIRLLPRTKSDFIQKDGNDDNYEMRRYIMDGCDKETTDILLFPPAD